MTYFLGLTGSIATGKSTVGKIFLEHDIPVISGDEVAKKTQEKGQPAFHAIVQAFGQEVLFADGTLNRKKLGSIVFSNPEKMEELDKLMNTFLREAFATIYKKYQESQVPLVVLDIPLLFEKDYTSLMDEIMVVYLPETIQLSRLMERNHLSEKEAKQRISSQWSVEKKKQLADVIINNSGSVEETRKQVEDWLTSFNIKQHLG
ncbi:MAG: dephospho-CoA kinase [Lactobacillales bacterium]|jgi:dephospho-CoA kinase|nr:dephospho-CoA kinase [Lactobacillales bacterium]